LRRSAGNDVSVLSDETAEHVSNRDPTPHSRRTRPPRGTPAGWRPAGRPAPLRFGCLRAGLPSARAGPARARRHDPRHLSRSQRHDPRGPEVVSAMIPYLGRFRQPVQCPARPGSPGRDAVGRSARGGAEAPRADPSEIVFTSCARSEQISPSRGSAGRSASGGDHVATSAVEHKSVSSLPVGSSARGSARPSRSRRRGGPCRSGSAGRGPRRAPRSW